MSWFRRFGFQMMFRLTAFLIAGLYLVLLVGGADHGQKRFGLRDAPPSAAETETVAIAASVPADPAAPVEQAALAAEAALPQGVAAMPVVNPASFQPEEGTEVFSLANPNVGLMELVPDEEAAAALASAPEPEPMPEESEAVWAVVMAEAVNVRTGPSTIDSVAGRLVLGDEVMLVGPEVDGWVQVRIEGDGMDESLLPGSCRGSQASEPQSLLNG